MNKTIRIQSIFFSISGEFGYFHQGEPVIFIRFAGCNLNCKNCDTAHSINSKGIITGIDDILYEIRQYPVKRVLITGGEPLLQTESLDNLISELHKWDYEVSVETNGSFYIGDIVNQPEAWIVDIKLPGSNMDRCMMRPDWLAQQISTLEYDGTLVYLKFPINNLIDFHSARDLIGTFFNKCKTALSPISPTMPADKLWDLMVEHKLTDSVLNTQIHKFIWPDTKIER